MKRILELFIISIMVLGISSNAYAYLDPGTGSMLLQSLIGAIAATWMVASIYWQRIKLKFNDVWSKLTKNSDPEV